MNLLSTPRGRRLLFAGLYFSEGAPMGFLWWALPTRLRGAGVAPEEIAALVALLVLPWTLKVLVAPAVDLLRSSRFGLRGWILAAQAMMGLTLLPLLLLDLEQDFDAILVALVAHALCAATQDAAIDTLALRTVPVAERGAITGWMQLGMLSARSLFGGGALLVAARLGDDAIVWLLIAATWSTGALLVVGVPRDAVPPPEGALRARFGRFAARFGAMLRRRSTWLGFAVATLAGAGFKSLTAIAGPFLVDRGASQETIGLFFLVPAVVGMAIGALLGGRIADRSGRRGAVARFELAAAAIVVAIGAAALLPALEDRIAPFLVLLGVLYVAIGCATAALYALFMDLTDPALAATQFCLFMAGINLCEAWSTRALGSLISAWGYGWAFMAMATVSALSLLLLRFVPHPEREAPAAA